MPFKLPVFLYPNTFLFMFSFFLASSVKTNYLEFDVCHSHVYPLTPNLSVNDL